jgi:hypothetical protein
MAALRDYTVNEAGFFYGTYYAAASTISLTEEQAKYELMHGSITPATVLEGTAATEGIATLMTATEEESPTAPPMIKMKLPRKSISSLE